LLHVAGTSNPHQADMTCSVPQYGIPHCDTEHVMSIYWNVCLMMVTCTRNI